MSRQQRELDELHALCRSGAVDHAVDLAFEHFAQFGRDDEIVGLLAAGIDGMEAAGHGRRRLAELCASYPCGCPAGFVSE